MVDRQRRLALVGDVGYDLTGVDLTSYGVDQPGSPALGRLVQHILKLVPELKRLRLSSIDQVDVDADLLRVIADEPRLMPHQHISFRAGDDMILKRVKRLHLGSGFPTETGAMFGRSKVALDAEDRHVGNLVLARVTGRGRWLQGEVAL